MLRRLLIGLVLGLLVGGLMAAAFVFGLKRVDFGDGGGTVLAYLAAAVVGVATGLVAGKPIWASDAKIEAGLKAVVGALLGAGALFALKQWAAGWIIDLSFLRAGGPAAVGALPAASLPLIAATLGALFELDNTGEAVVAAKPGDRKRIAPQRANGAAKSLAAEGDGDGSASLEAEAGSKRSKR